MINLKKIISKLNKNGINSCDVAFVLGSGLSNALPNLTNRKEFSYKELGIIGSKVQGHNSKIVYGEFEGKKIISLCRIHYYEYGNFEYSNIPLLIASKLNVNTVIMATAVGACNESYKPGDLMIIKDHINLTGNNPLIGIEKLKFVDMSKSYDEKLINLVNNYSISNGLGLKIGVHAQFSGPCYETPAEIKFLQKIGADTVSMSTATDVIFARYLNIKVLAFASICNMGSGLSNQALSHNEVLEIGNNTTSKLLNIIEYVLKNI